MINLLINLFNRLHEIKMLESPNEKRSRFSKKAPPLTLGRFPLNVSRRSTNESELLFFIRCDTIDNSNEKTFRVIFTNFGESFLNVEMGTIK